MRTRKRLYRAAALAATLCSCGTVDESGGLTTFNTKSLTFNGTSSYLENTTQVVSNFPFSISAWVKTTASSTQTVAGIFVSGSSNQHYRITISGTGMPTIEASNTTNRTAASTTAINDGEWHHVVGVFASSTSRTLYVDGVSKATSATAATFTASINRFAVGRNSNSAPGSYFNGNIDEVSLWNVALGLAEVTTVYNSGSPSVIAGTAGLVSSWRLGDGSSDDLDAGTIADQSASLNLTAIGMTSSNLASDVP